MTAVRAFREWAVVVAASPVLAFPSAVPLATVGVLTLLVAWLVAGSRVQGVSLHARLGRLRWPWLVLAAMMVVGAAISPYRDLTLPKLAGLVLGMLVLRALLLTATTVERTRAFAWCYLAIGVATVASALLIRPAAHNDNLPYVKYPAIWAISERLPRVVSGVAGAERGVNLNALGGTTLFFLPLALTVVATCVAVAIKQDQVLWLGAAAAAATALLVGFGLLLSQSRTSWVSASLAVGILGVVGLGARRWRLRLLLGVGAAAVTGGLAFWIWRNQPALSSGLVAFSRWDAWRVAVDALLTQPLTGVGLGAFRRVAEVMQVAAPDPILPLVHAHNVFLQTALDVGLPGLAAYVALLANATLQAFRVSRDASVPVDRAIALGLWGGLLAVHIFGVLDSISLGAKVGVFVWANLGLLAALDFTTRRPGAAGV